MLSAAGAHALPFHLRTCPLDGLAALTSVSAFKVEAPPLWSTQLSVPLPSVFKTWSALPSSFGNTRV